MQMCVCVHTWEPMGEDKLPLTLAEEDQRFQGRGALRDWNTCSVSAWGDALGGHWDSPLLFHPPNT